MNPTMEEKNKVVEVPKIDPTLNRHGRRKAKYIEDHQVQLTKREMEKFRKQMSRRISAQKENAKRK